MPAPGPAVRTIGQVKAQAKADAEKRAAEEAQWSRDAEREMPTPEMLARWKLKWKELKAEARLTSAPLAGSAGRWGTPRVDARSKTLRSGELTSGIQRPRRDIHLRVECASTVPRSNQYYHLGKVRIHRGAFDKTVENGWIQGARAGARKRR